MTPDAGSSMAVVESVFGIIHRKTKINPGDGRPLGIRVEFDNVTFSYPSRMKLAVLRNFSFVVEPGQTTAFVGASGSGKSTVIALLERFYDPVEGRVMVDDQDIRTLNLRDLRKQIGLVNQEPSLFPMSIRDNIAYGVESASDAEIEEAAKVANAHMFISGLPEGYSTNAGEGGAQLSGGQRQRIAIARAVLKNPRILLLDEATSALDVESEHEVQSALDKVMVGRTTIVVAHRLSTIQNAHIIAVVQDGAICEQGTHTDLVARRAAYYSLLKPQRTENRF